MSNIISLLNEITKKPIQFFNLCHIEKNNDQRQAGKAQQMLFDYVFKATE
jgi:hypothetical protein